MIFLNRMSNEKEPAKIKHLKELFKAIHIMHFLNYSYYAYFFLFAYHILDTVFCAISDCFMAKKTKINDTKCIPVYPINEQ